MGLLLNQRMDIVILSEMEGVADRNPSLLQAAFSKRAPLFLDSPA
jgi:hypothetical protein